MEIVHSFYEKFNLKYIGNLVGDCHWEFKNNGYKMDMRIMLKPLSTIYAQGLGISESYILDYIIVNSNNPFDENIIIEQYHYLPTGQIKSQLKFIEFTANCVTKFINPIYNGEKLSEVHKKTER